MKMKNRKEEYNQNTQPLLAFKVFNNWNVVAKGWYIVCRSSEIAPGQSKSFEICHQKIVIFRTLEGKLGALDAFCPHMGVDLGLGKVVGNHLRCFFHHWEFNQQGECKKIPCGEAIGPKSKTNSYAITEKYHHLWIYPEAKAPHDVIDIPGLEGQEVLVQRGKDIIRTCHHHINMINGIDPQHLKTVHKIDIDMALEMNESQTEISFTLRGEIGNKTWKERLTQFLIGKTYAYSMKYADGCNGALTLMKDVYFLGGFKKFYQKKKIPELYMLYAYRPLPNGQTLVVPLFITPKRKGLWGSFLSFIALSLTKLGFYALQGEDGEVYQNIRFNSQNLLKLDVPVAKYIAYVNRLTPSVWSRKDS